MLQYDLRRIRKHKGHTQHAIAELAALSIPSVIQLERGCGTIASLEKLLSALNSEVWGMHMETEGTLGNRVQRLRVRAKLGQRKVATLAGVTQSTISNIERFNSGRLETLINIARFSGCELRAKERFELIPFYSGTALQSQRNEWYTPIRLIDILEEAVGRFDLDPCAETDVPKLARSRAAVCYSEKDNGLSKPWFGAVFVNPPYGRGIAKWVKKCRTEYEDGRAETVIALLASRTDTAWWHDHIEGKAMTFFLRGRLKFGDGKNSAPFPSAIVVWGYDSELNLADALKQI